LASSNSLLRGLASCLLPPGLQISIISGILLFFTLATCRSQYLICIFLCLTKKCTKYLLPLTSCNSNMFRYPSVHHQGAVCRLKLQTTECNQLLHVGVINKKIRILKYRKIQQADTLLNLLIIFSYLPLVKDALGLRTQGVYGIPCECHRVYIGQRSIRPNPNQRAQQTYKTGTTWQISCSGTQY
jgi:hypothetical protein